jgi:ABC-type proline/glycine betaine transport system ATPase subunit
MAEGGALNPFACATIPLAGWLSAGRRWMVKDGRVMQIGTPEDIVTAPADDCVADLVAGVSRLSLVTAARILQPINGSGGDLSAVPPRGADGHA